MSEPDKTKWVGVRPIDPAENIPVEPGAGIEFEVVQPTAADLKVEATIAAAQQIEVVQTVPANCAVSVTQAAKDRYIKKPSAAVQIIKYIGIVTGNATLHTVTAGKTFYLTSASLNAFNYSGGINYTHLSVINDVAVLQFIFAYLMFNIHERGALSYNFNPPIEILENWVVILHGAYDYIKGVGIIQGYEK